MYEGVTGRYSARMGLNEASSFVPFDGGPLDQIWAMNPNMDGVDI